MTGPLEQNDVNTNMGRVKLSIYREVHFSVMIFVWNGHYWVLVSNFVMPHNTGYFLVTETLVASDKSFNTNHYIVYKYQRKAI